MGEVKARVLAVVWLAVGTAVWCGFFDFYIERGAREFIRRDAQLEQRGETAAPFLPAVMSQASRDGALAASIWAAVVTGCGWATIGVCRRATAGGSGRRAAAPDDDR